MIKQMRQQGAYIVDIATQIGCSERTVRRYLKYPEPPARKTRHKMVKLKPFMDYIDMRLAENVWNSEVIFAEIKAMGYTGRCSMLRYYIQPKCKMRPSKRTVRFETQPGYQLQHDWGEVEVEVAGQRCKVNFAVNTLGFSRRFHVFAAPKQDAEHTYESLALTCKKWLQKCPSFCTLPPLECRFRLFQRKSNLFFGIAGLFHDGMASLLDERKTGYFSLDWYYFQGRDHLNNAKFNR